MASEIEYRTVDELLAHVLRGIEETVNLDRAEDYVIMLGEDHEHLLHRESWCSQRLPPSLRARIVTEGARDAFTRFCGITVLYGGGNDDVVIKMSESAAANRSE